MKSNRKRLSQAYSNPCQTSKMKSFTEIVNGFQLITIQDWQSSELINTWASVPSIIFFACIMFLWIFALARHLWLFHFWFKLHFLPSNLHLYSPDTPFVNDFDSFIPVNILKILKFKCSILFRTHTLLDRPLRVLQLQKQPTRGALKKRFSENMQQIYRTTPMSKCDFNKVALQLYWNRTLAWVFSCKFAAYFQNMGVLPHILIYCI